jgi:hypothetical protein
MEQYAITLKNEKLKQYDRIALFIIIINLALFIYLIISSPLRSARIASAVGAVLIIAALSIDYFLIRIKNNEGTPYKLFAEYIISMTWLQMEYWWIALLCFVLSSFYFIAKRQLLVNVFKEKIIYPSFPKKNIAWTELANIILKDGLLTINFKNNRFIQQFIDETKSPVDEKEFNEFCTQQLNK